MKKCVWCGEPAGLIIRVIVSEEKTSSENPICWSCMYNAAKKRVEVKK